MKSKLVNFFAKIKATEEIKCDFDAMTKGKGDLRHAMGIAHLPEDKPVMYFMFQNSDTGPEVRYWETGADEHPSDSLNRVSRRAASKPSSRSRKHFDQQHFVEIARENTRPTMPANMAKAISIDDDTQFERLAMRAGRAFLADAQFAGDLSLTVAYIPSVGAKWPMKPPYQLTFSPSLDPVMPVARIAPKVVEQPVEGKERAALVVAIGAIKKAMKPA